MASILSQCEGYFCLHEPFLFPWHLLSSFVRQLFLVQSASSIPLITLLGAHGRLAYIIYQAHSQHFIKLIFSYCYRSLIKHVATEPYTQLLVHYYTPSIATQKRCHCGLKSSKMFWKYASTTPCLCTFCTKEGAQSLHKFHQKS